MKSIGSRKILVINRGSATLKATLYQIDAKAQQVVLTAKSNRQGLCKFQVIIADAGGRTLDEKRLEDPGPTADLEVVVNWLDQQGYLIDLGAVGHRIVQGGTKLREPRLIDGNLIADLRNLLPLDPDHLPEAIESIQFFRKRFPKVSQVACFDSAFHSGLPKVAQMYAIPRKFYDQGIRRFGFHGLSFEFVMGELGRLEGPLAEGRVVIAHLGSGASMVAVKAGQSIDTTMGFTPLEGLVMGTRSGDVDPGILTYLISEGRMSSNEVAEMLNKKSGLLGISGETADMRNLLEAVDSNEFAREAVELFCYRAKKYIGAYAAVLGGIDLLVFTGGIGERAAAVRDKICAGLTFLGIELDAASNAADAAVISAAASAVHVRVIETDEDLMIFRHVRAVLGWT